MVPEDAYVDSWQAPMRKDPSRFRWETQLDLLLKADVAIASR